MSYLVLTLGDFVLGDIIIGDFVLWDFVQKCFCPRGLCPKGFCHGGFGPKPQFSSRAPFDLVFDNMICFPDFTQFLRSSWNVGFILH